MKDYTSTLEYRKAVVKMELWLLEHKDMIDQEKTIVQQAREMVEAEFDAIQTAMRGDVLL